MLTQLKSRLFGNSAFSKKAAKNRLQMVLVQDRSGLSSEEMDNFQKDLLGVIGKYFVLEHKGVQIDWQRNDNCTALVINTPVANRRREAGEIDSSESSVVNG